MGLFHRLFQKNDDAESTGFRFSFSAGTAEENPLQVQLEEELELALEEQEELEELLEELDCDPPEEGSSGWRRREARRALYTAQIDELQREAESLERRIEALEDSGV